MRRVITLGSPHQGAPLARVGERAATLLSAVDLPATQVLSQLIRGRSAGIRDLEHGLGSAPDATRDLPIRWHLVAGSAVPDPTSHLTAWLGDLLVPVHSAHDVGPHPAVDRGHVGGVLHHQLQNHREVYDQVRRAVEDPELA